MFDAFRPERTADSVYSVDFSQEYASGIRGLVLDIDNTLVPQDAPADERAETLVRNLKQMGFRVCLISNNGLKRVKSFADAVGASFIHKARKPAKKAYYRAMEALSTGPDDTLFIGDQLFTDVLGAKRAGLKHLLVQPIDPKTDTPFVRVKRIFERPFLGRRA